MKKKYFIILFFIANYTFSQANNNFDWLIGSWKTNNSKALIIETWKKQNDSLYYGFSSIVKLKDTIPEENIELKKIGADWFFIATVAKQNKEKPVFFKIIFNKDKEFICENVGHDFPQRIIYRLYKKSLLASIEGKVKSVFKKINYDYERE